MKSVFLYVFFMGKILLFVIINWVGLGGYSVILVFRLLFLIWEFLNELFIWEVCIWEFCWEFFVVVFFVFLIILLSFVESLVFVGFVVVMVLLVGIMDVFWLLCGSCYGIFFFIIMLYFGCLGVFFFFFGKLVFVMVCVGMRVMVVVSVVVVLLGLVVMINVFVFEVVVLLMMGFVLFGYLGLFVMMRRFFVFSNGVYMLLNMCILCNFKWKSCIVKLCMMRFFFFSLWSIIILFWVFMIFFIIGMYGFCLLCFVWLKMWWILVSVWMVMKDNEVCIIIGDVIVEIFVGIYEFCFF